MKTDIVFENLKEGQEVYSLQYGKGVVDKLIENDLYAITCKFIDSERDEATETFTKEGKYTDYHHFPTLFLTNPFEKLNQERVIEVFDCGKWLKRICIKVVDEVAICWCDAVTFEESKRSNRTHAWSTWRELQPEQPAAEQPKEITIDGVEYVLTPKTK